MSDFDKEAEREKLRKRFTEEEEDRETTERMSELLLQGATMTNTHCDTCGDPLFRYDGQTFCSTCQQAVENNAETADDDESASPETATERATDDGQRIVVDDPHDQPTDQPPTNVSEGERPEPATRGQRAPPSQTSGDASDANRRPQTSNASRSGENTNDLAATEASLARTLRQQATAAEEIDGPERTREHLAAAREAAKALEAVRNAGR